MCKAKYDPGYYRCEWKHADTQSFIGALSNAAIEVSTVVDIMKDEASKPINIKIQEIEALEAAQNEAKEAVKESVMEHLGPTSKQGKRKRAAKDLKQNESHLLCAVAAAVGEACSKITNLPSALANEVGRIICKETSSKTAGKLAEKVTGKLLVSSQNAVNSVKSVGIKADIAAIVLCPAQQGEHPASKTNAHPEVDKCWERLNNLVLDGLVSSVLPKI